MENLHTESFEINWFNFEAEKRCHYWFCQNFLLGSSELTILQVAWNQLTLEISCTLCQFRMLHDAMMPWCFSFSLTSLTLLRWIFKFIVLVNLSHRTLDKGRCLGCTRGFWLGCARGLCLGCARGRFSGSQHHRTTVTSSRFAHAAHTSCSSW